MYFVQCNNIYETIWDTYYKWERGGVCVIARTFVVWRKGKSKVKVKVHLKTISSKQQVLTCFYKCFCPYWNDKTVFLISRPTWEGWYCSQCLSTWPRLWLAVRLVLKRCLVYLLSASIVAVLLNHEALIIHWEQYKTTRHNFLVSEMNIRAYFTVTTKVFETLFKTNRNILLRYRYNKNYMNGILIFLNYE